LTDLIAATAFCVLMAAEFVWPRRRSTGRLGERWLGNGGLFVVNAALATGFGTFVVASSPSGWAAWAAGLLFLDLLSYALHRLSHVVPALWRLHRVHHTDVDLDVTTALRHHPLEFALVWAATTLIALAVGLATEIVAVYGVLSLACQAAQHANVALPSPVERALGRIVVTPAFHAVHHSIDRVQHDSNFGTILSIWDRLLGTAMAAEPLHFGVADLGDPRYQRLPGMLLTPFA
jgi:sterol desaturase/sphingolipid hydroxylase (fatty acid hydroxylase superfamily)